MGIDQVSHGANRDSPPLYIGVWNLGSHGYRQGSVVAKTLATRHEIGIIILTETHIDDDSALQQLFAAELGPRWTFYWSGVPRSANVWKVRGVCIAIREDWMAHFQGIVTVLPLPLSLGGTVCAVGLGRGEDRVLIAGVYIPDSSADRAKRGMGHLAAQLETMDILGKELVGWRPQWPKTIIAGDWNFGLHANDRPMGGLNVSDKKAIARWYQSGLGEFLIDPYRHKFPCGKATSFVHPAHRTPHRLDRCYVSSEALARACVITHHPVTLDATSHNLIVVKVPMHRYLSKPTGLYKRHKADLSVLHDLQVVDWIKNRLTKAPAEEEDLCTWWETFKKGLVKMARTTGRQRRVERVTKLRMYEAEAEVALEALTTAPSSALAYDEWRRSQAKILQLLGSVDGAVRWGRSFHKLPICELPSEKITTMLSPKCKAPPVDALITGQGRILYDKERMASAMGTYSAGIHAAYPINTKALDKMASLVAAKAPPRETFLKLQDREVTMEEVLHVLTKVIKRGKATGLDGIAGEFYIEHAALFAPVMARLFSAINRMGHAPLHFTEGLVVYLHKGIYVAGQATSPGNLRPITLLGSDYKTYSLVFVTRLTPMLMRAIPTGQSAFLQDRLITDNVLTIRAVHDMLVSKGDRGVAMDLDIAKAYDQVSRLTLRRLWEALGGGQSSFWLSVLCEDTFSRAFLNGYVSKRFELHAGVRQGCPASPGLYLVVALGLTRLLKEARMGIPTYGKGDSLHIVVAPQYADDTCVLNDVHSIPRLRHTMEFYRQASGQRINWDKTRIVPLGLWPEGDLPYLAPACTMMVGEELVKLPPVQVISLDKWEPLHIPFVASVLHSVQEGHGRVRIQEAGLQQRVDVWQDRRKRFHQVATNIGRGALTMFGKASAIGAYAYQAVAYHLQLIQSDKQEVKAWMQDSTNVVNGLGTQGKTGMREKFSPCSHEILTTSTREAGFGLMDFNAHLSARQAKFGAELVQMKTDWALIYQEVLTTLPIFQQSGFHRLMLLNESNNRPWPPTDVPGISFALDSLHQPQASVVCSVGEHLQAAGPWCAGIPIWHNPYIVTGTENKKKGMRPWVMPHIEGAQCQVLNVNMMRVDTIGHVILLDTFLCDQPMRGAPIPAKWIMRPFHGPTRTGASANPTSRDLLHKHGLKKEIEAIKASIPQVWLEAARDAIRTDARSPLSVARMDLESVDILIQGCYWERKGQAYLPLKLATVRILTEIFGATALEAKTAKVTTFILRAMDMAPGSAMPDGMLAVNVFSMMNRMARLPCPNTLKESMWLLVYNGYNIPSRRGDLTTGCACGQKGPHDLKHAFWTCEVAQEIRTLLEGPLAACGSLQSEGRLSCVSVWIAQTPEKVAQWVWDVMVLVAIHAMNQGRKELARGDTSTCNTNDKARRVQNACVRAKRAFWQGLGRAAQYMTLNKERSRQLDVSGTALQGRLPFLRPSQEGSKRVEFGLIFQPP